MGNAMKVFKAQESFELTRAKDEGRDPNIYHGVFSDHPAPDERIVQRDARCGEHDHRAARRLDR